MMLLRRSVLRSALIVAGALAVYSAGAITLASNAAADLRLCNKTQARIGIAIGYKHKGDWTTEGWWNIESGSCQALLSGTLSSRYYYVYAVDYDQGGEWAGKAFMCTRDKEFTIEGVSDCIARGFKKTGFFEVDTGEQSGWTVQLTEPANRGIGGR